MRKDLNFSPKPIKNKVEVNELNTLLCTKHVKKIICFHNWVYWTFGPATKYHRVCKKCYKKQQYTSILPKYSGTWIKETHF
jgi:hypothetical protein